MSKLIPSFSVRQLFENNDAYVIPIYQRNYTWGQGEIYQLVQDIFDYAFDPKKCTSNYYIGTLVVNDRHIENKIIYETIDGQQRLTSLNILINALHRVFENKIETQIDYKLNLKFDSRKKSTETLNAIVVNPLQKGELFLSTKEYNSNIKQRYFDAEKIIKQLIKPSEINVFYNYLADKVQVVRASVPEETDLNHYFEIMNNRGEQLEKHEILKAKMLEVLKGQEHSVHSEAFNLIWEACSDMERYVQYGFSPDQRDLIFGKSDWNNLIVKNLDEIANTVSAVDNNTKQEDQTKILSLEKIIEYKGAFNLNVDHKEEAPDRFNSVINFQNFLLHVLRIQTESDISLDDKRLLDSFKEFIESDDKINFVKEFGFNLLRCKHLFDQYIIKREFHNDDDRWSLKKLKWYDKNRINYVNTCDDDLENGVNKEILMLLSMFHVSTPTLVYKHWLNAALFYLFKQEEIVPSNYKEYLENLARAYLFDRFIKKEDEIDYFTIIYTNEGKPVNRFNEKLDLRKLNQGTAVENFVFNYLDYILWQEGTPNFEFTFRSSVEHYYPRNPISPSDNIDASVYDLFGNLCLISNSKNSRLSNYMPTAKKEHYKNVKTDSLKQQLMMESDLWTETEIKYHGEEMIKKLLNF